jgi:hypothetical protein
MDSFHQLTTLQAQCIHIEFMMPLTKDNTLDQEILMQKVGECFAKKNSGSAILLEVRPTSARRNPRGGSQLSLIPIGSSNTTRSIVI